MKLVLGVANLNQSYGLNNEKTSEKKSIEIINYSKDKIKYIDTASAYSGFNNILYKINLEKFKINTKISDIKGKDFNEVYSDINKKINLCLKNYKKKKINILFLHRPREILNKRRGKYIIKSLKKLKQKKIIKQIGFSIYSTSEILVLIKTYKPDIIQGPFSLFDQRILNSGVLKILKKKNIKFQARSIFLQGIILNKKILNNEKFKIHKALLLRWFNWLKTEKLDPELVLINFIKKHRYNLDSVIISAKNLRQIKKNFLYFKKRRETNLINLGIISKKIIDPRKWN